MSRKTCLQGTYDFFHFQRTLQREARLLQHLLVDVRAEGLSEGAQQVVAQTILREKLREET